MPFQQLLSPVWRPVCHDSIDKFIRNYLVANLHFRMCAQGTHTLPRSTAKISQQKNYASFKSSNRLKRPIIIIISPINRADFSFASRPRGNFHHRFFPPLIEKGLARFARIGDGRERNKLISIETSPFPSASGNRRNDPTTLSVEIGFGITGRRRQYDISPSFRPIDKWND